MSVRFPQVLGNEFAGIVDQIGDGVTDFAVGSEVLGWQTLACYAELVVANLDQVVAKPPAMSWEVAGALSASGQAAHTALTALGIGPGDTLLVHAAAGGVGTVAVQLARAWGATVIGTASEGNHDYLRSLGAIPVTYGDGLVEQVRDLAPHGVTAVLDAIGGEAPETSLRLGVAPERIVTLVPLGTPADLGIRALRTQRSVARLAELASLWDQGKLQITTKGFPLSAAAEAHRDIETGHSRGKRVLVIPPSRS